MANIFKIYIIALFALIICMFILLYRDSQQPQLFLEEDRHHPRQPFITFDNKSQYRDAHGHDHRHEHGDVAHDIEDDDDSHEFTQQLPLIKDKPWGQKYTKPRVVCLVPTLWPKKKFVMEV